MPPLPPDRPTGNPPRRVLYLRYRTLPPASSISEIQKASDARSHERRGAGGHEHRPLSCPPALACLRLASSYVLHDKW